MTIKIAAVSLPLRPGRSARVFTPTPQPAGASNTAEVALPQSRQADPLRPGGTRSVTPHDAALPDVSSDARQAHSLHVGADLPPGHAAVGRAARRATAASGGA